MVSAASLRDDYVAALVRPDARQARVLIADALSAGADPRVLYLDVLAPALHEVGRRWQVGEISVAAEHIASSTTETVMAELAGSLRADRPERGIAVVACVGEELHRLGGRVVADFLEADGWIVDHVGAMVPVDQIVDAVARRGADLVALSVTLPARVPDLVRACQALKALDPPPLVVAGGQGLGGSARVPADLQTHDPREMVRWAARHTPAPGPPRKPPGGPPRIEAAAPMDGFGDPWGVADISVEDQRSLVEQVLELNQDLVNARRELTRQRDELARVVETLQRSLLPQALPDVEGLRLAARYVPGTAHRVGGDWYDALLLPDGTLAVAIGDVAGKGLAAAATMGEVRSALRAYALDESDPARVLAKADRLVARGNQMVTAVIATLDPRTGRWRHASAGHPPPLVLHADGRAEFLDHDRRGPLMVYEPAEPAERVLTAGARVVLYTDGLIERRDEPLDASLERLRAVAADSGAGLDVDRLCDVLLATAPTGAARDDVALLVVELPRTSPHE